MPPMTRHKDKKKTTDIYKIFCVRFTFGKNKILWRLF